MTKKMAIRKLKPITFTLDLNQIALNRRKFNTEEIGRGIGVHKISKGKGSYTRKEKHKKKSQWEKETSVIFIKNMKLKHVSSWIRYYINVSYIM
jgi:hypothetical protein